MDILDTRDAPAPNWSPRGDESPSLVRVLWVAIVILLMIAHRLAKSNTALAYRQMCESRARR